MIRIKAVYTLPAINQVLLIAAFPDTDLDSPKPSEFHISRKQLLEHIGLDKSRMLPSKSLRWKVRIVPENDFLLSIADSEAKKQTLAIQSSHSSESMELLAINLAKTPESSCDPSKDTPTVLSRLQDQDIIEVFV